MEGLQGGRHPPPCLCVWTKMEVDQEDADESEEAMVVAAALETSDSETTAPVQSSPSKVRAALAAEVAATDVIPVSSADCHDAAGISLILTPSLPMMMMMPAAGDCGQERPVVVGGAHRHAHQSEAAGAHERGGRFRPGRVRGGPSVQGRRCCAHGRPRPAHQRRGEAHDITPPPSSHTASSPALA